jgi:hypothetical protein
MRSQAGLLPSSLTAPRVSARVWLALAAGIGAGICGYAGLYPRFDDGALRIALALTCAPFGAAVVAAASSARTPGRAFGLALLFATILGVGSVVLPAALLTHDDVGQFVFGCVFGAFFGAPTGAFYGIPLALLANLGHEDVHAETHEATDRAARVAGIWLFCVGLVALAGTLALDGPRETAGTAELGQAARATLHLPAYLACAASLAGVIVAVVASFRIRRRSSWIERVRSGLEPAFRVRAADARDRIEGLPRLGRGATVVEYVADEASSATAGTAYRVAAVGTPIAVVSDPAS